MYFSFLSLLSQEEALEASSKLYKFLNVNISYCREMHIVAYISQCKF